MSPDKNSIDVPKEPLRNERDNKNMQIQPRQTGSFGNVADHPSRQNTQFASTSFPGSNRDIMNNFEQISAEYIEFTSINRSPRMNIHSSCNLY